MDLTLVLQDSTHGLGLRRKRDYFYDVLCILSPHLSIVIPQNMGYFQQRTVSLVANLIDRKNSIIIFEDRVG